MTVDSRRKVSLRLKSLRAATYNKPQRLYGAAVLRILLGFGALLLLAGDYGNRAILWGPDAAILGERSVSLLRLSDGSLIFEVVFHASLGAILAFTIFGGRILGVIFAIVLASFYNRNLSILDGGDNLVQLVCLPLPLLITDAHWSPLARRRRENIERIGGESGLLQFALHNCGMLVIMFQTATVYVSAGLWKVAGEAWRHGFALDVVASSQRFGLSGHFRTLVGYGVVVAFVSYATVTAQLVFVPLVVSGRSSLRVLGVSLVAVMHLGIMSVMGLVGFGINMIAADSAFLTDSDYRRKIKQGRGVYRRLRRLIPAK